jgi:alginate O-acetyltransferase complex protein AlgI
MLTGFWHGAEWTFIVWGLYFGILLIIEKTFLLKWLEKTKVFSHIYILILVLFSFVLFDSAGLGDALSVISSMLGVGGIPFMTEVTGYYVGSYLVMFVIAIVGATPLPKMLVSKVVERPGIQKVTAVLEPVVMMVILVVATGYLVDGSFNPFLYFRF